MQLTWHPLCLVTHPPHLLHLSPTPAPPQLARRYLAVLATAAMTQAKDNSGAAGERVAAVSAGGACSCGCLVEVAGSRARAWLG